mmetsp:Transcript_3476/g.4661  ORF Transcript_3476/g.4661 Transcript_3476/m.4661 type:complete len:357 (+) Transcript_3476:190-1260(+)
MKAISSSPFQWALELPSRFRSLSFKSTKSDGNYESRWWYAIYGLVGLAIFLLLKFLFIDLGLYDRLMNVNEWLQYLQGSRGLFLLFNLSTIASIISVPPLAVDVVMNIVAGAAFGTVTGTCIYVLGTSFGCCLAFQALKLAFQQNSKLNTGSDCDESLSNLSSSAVSSPPSQLLSSPDNECQESSLATSLSKNGKDRSMSRHFKWLDQYTVRAKRLSAAMKDDWTGLQITLLLRVSPITPLTICTVLLALTELRFGPYALGTIAGLIPASIPYCYLGAVGKHVHDNGIPRTVADLIGYALGGFATVLVSYKIYQISESVLENVNGDEMDEENRDACKELLQNTNRHHDADLKNKAS